MTEPSRTPEETQGTDVESGQLDPTLARPPGDFLSPLGTKEPEPEFGPPENAGEIGTIGRYRVLKKLGQGGMGAVYLGFDGKLGRRVALKVMRPEHAADPESRERFIREARASAMVRSDHVVTIFDVGEERGVAFIAMEYLSGSPLDQYLRTAGELPPAQTYRIGRETAIGLAAAHDLGLIHRDIKPGNIWLEAPQGRVKILDFGLARATNDDTHLTSSGLVVGTPAFMSPEQARGQKLDGRSDLFSLGVVLYRLATGKLPFDGPTTMAVLTSLAVDDPTPARQVKADVPAALEAVIHKLLAKKADDRYQTAWEAAAALRDAERAPAVEGASAVAPAVPLAVAPQSDNVWASIGASASTPRALESETAAAPAPKPKPERKKSEPRASKLTWVLAGVALLATVVAAAAVAILVVRPAKGTLLVESEDPEAALTIFKDGETVREQTRDSKIRLEPGHYTALVKGKPGTHLDVEKFEITERGEVRVRVLVARANPLVVKIAPPDPDRTAAEYALSVGGKVRVNGAAADIIDRDGLPNGPFALTRADLSRNKQVTDEGLAALKGCASLAELLLDSTPVTSAGLAHFKDCTTLKILDLSSTRVTAAGLAHFKGCRGLTVLRLSGTPVGDAGLVHFKGCAALEVLDLDTAGVSDAGLALLGPRPNLVMLNVRQTRVTDAGLANFAGSERLTLLNLAATRATDAGLANFKGCKKLTDLNVAGTRVTDVGLTHFKGCETMLDLEVTDTDVGDAGLASFRGSRGMVALVAGGSRVADAGLEMVRGFDRLVLLDVSRTGVTDAGLRHARECPALMRLVVRRTGVTPAGLADFAKARPRCKIEHDGGAIEPKK